MKKRKIKESYEISELEDLKPFKCKKCKENMEHEILQYNFLNIQEYYSRGGHHICFDCRQETECDNCEYKTWKCFIKQFNVTDKVQKNICFICRQQFKEEKKILN